MKHAPKKPGSSWNRAGCRENGYGHSTHNKHGRTDWSQGDQRKKTARHVFTELQAAPVFYPRGN